MARARRGPSDLGIQWYVPGRKRAIATTTVATSYLVALMVEDGIARTFNEIARENYYDTDVVQLCAAVQYLGYGDAPLVFVSPGHVQFASEVAR